MYYVYSFPSRYTQNSTIATRIDKRILIWYIYIKKISFRVLSWRCYGSLRNCCCCKLWASFVSHKSYNPINQCLKIKQITIPTERRPQTLNQKRYFWKPFTCFKSHLLLIWMRNLLFSKSLKAFLLRYLVRRELHP